MNADYDFELERVTKEITNAGVKEVALQLPEGLKHYAVEIASHIEKQTGARAYILADPVYGACDTKDALLESFGIGYVVHFGHSDLTPKV